MPLETQVQQFKENFNRVETEIHKSIVGQAEVIEGVLLCLFANGHVLLEGVPGLGKTQLVHTLSEALSLSFNRIQFTPDIMPSDITGTMLLVEDAQGRKQFEFQPGPIFAQLILADEINRATPRTQSALLEAMQERTVSVARTSHKLKEPFCVLATQNPIEMDGTYRLPEAQLDRFMFKIQIAFPDEDALGEILRRTTSEIPAIEEISDAETIQSMRELVRRLIAAREPAIEEISDAETIQSMRELVRRVLIAEHVERYIVRLIRATHPDNPNSPEMARQYVELGASIRGLQAITLTAKVKALLDGRYNVAFEDVQSVALPALRHRIILNFEGEGEGIQTDEIIQNALSSL